MDRLSAYWFVRTRYPDGNAQNRYVRVQLRATHHLALAELQVFGAISGGVIDGICGQVTVAGAGLTGVTTTLVTSLLRCH